MHASTEKIDTKVHRLDYPFVILYDPTMTIQQQRAATTRPNPSCPPTVDRIYASGPNSLVPTVLKNPSVLLTGLRFFLGSQVRKVEDFTNLYRNKNKQEISENDMN
jgi:hypothetical protein